MYDWLIERGYKHKTVEDQIKRACLFDRDELLVRKRPETEYKISLNIEYNSAFQKIGKVLNELNCILQGDSDHRKTFSEVPIVGFRNGKSLKSILVKAVLPKVETHKVEKGCVKCGGKRCEVCVNIKETREFHQRSQRNNLPLKKVP